MIAFSFLNLAEAATLAASTTFTEQDTTVGLRFPRHPHLRGYSADLATHAVTLDFGSTTALEVIALIHANFLATQFHGHATDAWASPTYSSVGTLAVATNDRYHCAFRPTVAVPFNYRFLRVYAMTGAATDGATRWALGGIWAGALVLPPQEILIDLEEDKLEARKDLESADGRLFERVVLDDPAFRLRATRRAYTEAELAAWRAIDRQWSAAPGQAALVCLRPTYPEECYVMRLLSVSSWHRMGSHDESVLEALEVTAG